MVYYHTLLTVFIGLAVVTFLVGLIIKQRLPRFIFWFFTTAFVVLTVSTVRKNSSTIGSETAKFIGEYVIDTASSEYASKPVAHFRDLKLLVSSNETFHFIGNEIPFLKSNGRWKYTNNEDGGLLECFFENKKLTAGQSVDNDYWVFQCDALWEGQPSDIFYFTKVR